MSENTNKIVLSRSNNDYNHTLVFEENKQYDSEYYIKSMNTSMNILIKTEKLIINSNKIEVVYQIVDSGIKYKYLIEMSDK